MSAIVREFVETFQLIGVGTPKNRLSNLQNDAGRSAKLDKELKDKTAMIGKLRHDCESASFQVDIAPALTESRRRP